VAELPYLLDRAHHVDLERRSAGSYVHRLVLVLLLALLGVALADVFGQSPSRSSVDGRTARLSVESPEALRGGLIFQTRIEVEARRQLRKAVLVLDSGWFEGMTLNSTVPTPIAWGQRDGRSALELGHIPAGERYVLRLQFQVNPTSIGGRTQDVWLEDGGKTIAVLHRSATVYP
jgi:hypothetical protein